MNGPFRPARISQGPMNQSGLTPMAKNIIVVKPVKTAPPSAMST